MKIRYEDVHDSEEVRSYIRKADESLIALGYTEHSFAHVTKVAETSRRILLTLGYPEREAELAAHQKELAEASPAREAQEELHD